MIFWALEQRKKRQEESAAKARASLIAEMLVEGIPQTKQELEQWAKDKGIPVEGKTPD